MRITCADDGVIAVDGASVGRGAWLCRSGDGGGALVVVSCLDAASTRRAFARAWRREVTPADEHTIRERLGLVAGSSEGPDAH